MIQIQTLPKAPKANGLFKKTSDGGALGDICLLEINYCKADGSGHVVIATGSGAGRVVNGKSTRTAAEIVGDAGSTSCVNLDPNGKPYELNDIDYLVKKCGYTLEAAFAELSIAGKYLK